MSSSTRRHFLKTASAAGAIGLLPGFVRAGDQKAPLPSEKDESQPRLLDNRFFTFNTVVRVNQIEATRDKNLGADEGAAHTPEAAKMLREAFVRAWPGGRMTWAFSWLALQDQRPNYKAIRKLVVEYHKNYGDEITFIPGGFFANMYSTREQVNKDLHEGLAMASQMVGGGYRPRSVVAGFLAAENLRYLAEQENIHVCQGNIWSQYAIDNGDGEGSVCYPYYPSCEHFCKPAQGKGDFIDCVNLDGWTVDFLAARRAGCGNGQNSRMGIGPIETILTYDAKQAMQELMHVTATHFDRGFELNRFAWLTDCWELSLVGGRGQAAKADLTCLTNWLAETRRRWPKAICVTQGEFGEAWRRHYHDNSFNLQFEERGSGIGGSDKDMEIRWFMNRDFRLALLRNWKKDETAKVIDFTRYDLRAEEPRGTGRNFSLMNRLNQKGVRPQDKPRLFAELRPEDQAFIRQKLKTL